MSNTIPPPTKTDNIANLEDAEFENIVSLDVRKQLDSHVALQLRGPTCVLRWYSTLVSMKRNIEAQYATKNAALRETKALSGDQHEVDMAIAEFERWKGSVAWFHSGVETRLMEAKKLKNELFEQDKIAGMARELHNAKSEVLRLRSAILQHKAADDADAADTTLYAVLGDIND